MLSLTLAFLVKGALEPAPVATADLTAQIEAVLDTPAAEVISELEQEVREFEARPQDVMADTALADELLRARVVLAWAQREPELAAAAMDEAIRSAAGRELPLLGLGTDLKNLAKQRAAALASEGAANIQVVCRVPCQVIVNERRSVNPTDPLLLGKYRVWVVSNDGEVEPLRADVELDVAGETERIEFGRVDKVPPAPGMVVPKRDPHKPPVPKHERKRESPLMPLWVEIAGIVAGAGLLATGVGLLAINGQCKDGGNPANCPIVIENTPQGAALAAVGSGMLVSFGTVLAVDRVRAGRSKGAGAMVGWTFRF